MYVVAVLVPVALIVTGVILIRNQVVEPRVVPPGTQQGQTSAPSVLNRAATCGAEPMPCNLSRPTECAKCGDSWECTRVGAEDTDYNIEGTFCLPLKPTSACTSESPDPTERMQGRYRWTGWGGLNVQSWECACPYPRFYPMDTTGGSITEGACKRSGEVCRHGVWKYPCRRVPGDPTRCAALSEEEEAALVGSDPLQNGMCDCSNVPCNSGADCASNLCIDGVCVGQRLGMDTTTGLPRCVRDTCREGTQWEVSDLPPYVFGRCV